jgi:hypothetical protein
MNFFVDYMEVPMSWYDDTNFRDLGARAFDRGLSRYAYPDDATDEQQDEFRRGWLRAEQATLDDAAEARRYYEQEQFQHFDPHQETFNDF